MNGNMTLERIMAPDTPEYADCTRCGIALSPTRGPGEDQCSDCKIVQNHRANQQRQRGALYNSTPMFEVTIHYSTSRYAQSSYPARLGVNAGGFTYLLSVVEDDPVAHHFVTDVLGHYTWPVVTVTSYGRLLAHWEGQEPGVLPNRYSQLQGLYDQVRSGTAKPLSI